jgi:hypothetical protein
MREPALAFLVWGVQLIANIVFPISLLPNFCKITGSLFFLRDATCEKPYKFIKMYKK